MSKPSKALAIGYIVVFLPSIYSDISSALIGNLFTPESYEWFKRLEFKNMLSRFSEVPKVEVENNFKSTDKQY